jgi:serine/threonine protein kinase
MLRNGQLLNQRYQLKHKLGQNAGRQTWQAEDVIASPIESVIVKLLAFSPQMQWEDLKLFEREANVLKQLNHSNIPKYHDHFSIDDRILWFSLVQSYISGDSLKDLLTKGRRFSESEVLTIASNLLEILIYLHELSPTVLHRDIKPSNIILGQDQKIYLVDFGAVQACAAKEGASFTIVGTYGYTPIEQFGGRAVPASDLYALGATLIHILTGTAPADLSQKNMRIQFREHLSISPYFCNWIDVLIEPNVEERFQTARQALEALYMRQGLQATPLSLNKPQSSRVRLRKSPYQLEIRLPRRGFQISDGFLIVLMLILYSATIPFSLVAFPFVVLFWLVGLIPIAMIILCAFGSTSLCLNRSQFVLRWKLFGLCYRSLKGCTTGIRNISENAEHSYNLNGEPLKMITIQVGEKKYKFSGLIAPISAAESQQLVQEIKNWLEFTNLYSKPVVPN